MLPRAFNMRLKVSSFLFIFGSLLGLVCGHYPYVVHHRPVTPYAATTHPQMYLYPINMLVNSEQGNAAASAAPPAAVPAPAPPTPCAKLGDSKTRVFTKLFSVPGAVADSLLSGEIII